MISTRTVKISAKTAKRLKVAAAVVGCTQEEVVEKALAMYWPSVKKKAADL